MTAIEEAQEPSFSRVSKFEKALYLNVFFHASKVVQATSQGRIAGSTLIDKALLQFVGSEDLVKKEASVMLVPSFKTLERKAVDAQKGFEPAYLGAEFIEEYADNAANSMGVLMKSTTADLSSFLEGVRAVQVGRVGSLFDKTIVSNLDWKTKADKIWQVATQNGRFGFFNINGRRYNARSYTELVVRTRGRELQTEATKNVLSQNGQLLVRVSTRRTDDDVCKMYDGKTYGLNSPVGRFPLLDRSPPFHPNCKHVLIPAKYADEKEARNAL